MNDTLDHREVLLKAIDHFGAKAQKIKAIEELGELSVELAKDANGLPCNIVEEMADVYIMLDQLHIIFSDERHDFGLLLDQQIAYKLNRLKNRIEDELSR